ncbi:UNKNOWN [Stylonychia lemnae]|uniref:Ribosome biogenesis protein NOP53 n=1 Tax=Stylonychia lemnae TaxID=5949 RepID=A0A078AWC3_STYLE|nr:UNKNOWN [Stylonychia lemnae]|eukprot:CDW85537.1 UNKNOWN [Stylonychia lemnae]
MTSKKKQWKKAIDHDELLDDLHQHNKSKNILTEAKSLKDDDLFKVNVNKTDLKNQREKLKRDRFKEKEKLYTSQVEQKLLKKLLDKQERKVPKKKEEEIEGAVQDIWGSEGSIVKTQSLGRNFDKFKKFAQKTQVKTKAVVVPLGGQSYNPSAKDHKEVIKKVVEQEFKEVKEQEKILRQLKPYLFEEAKKKEEEEKKKNEKEVKLVGKKRARTIDDPDSEEESDEENSDNEDGLEIQNKPVDRGNKLTRTERNLKLIKSLKKKAIQEQKKEKVFVQSLDKLPQYIQLDQIQKKKIQKGMDKRYKEKQVEKQIQEKVGVVSKPARIGKYNYQMKKIEFQTEDELAANLRQLKPQGPGDLLVDRFDSIFRRRMIEPAEPLNSDRKRLKKQKFKWHQSIGGKGANKLAKKNEVRKNKNTKKGQSSAQMLQNDLILI